MASVTFDLCRIPAGTFMMGDKDTGPVHQVTISRDFSIGKHQVTQAQWEAVMGSSPSKFKGADLPVETVSWDDCQEFIRRINEKGDLKYRLPTEAEWEYACRAGSIGTFCFGDDEALLGEHAWFAGNSDSQTHPVGLKKPNGWGLHDMHGNVLEWCADFFDEHYYSHSPKDDPQGPTSGAFRVLRGGSWYSKSWNARASFRFWGNQDYLGLNNGFRLAVSEQG